MQITLTVLLSLLAAFVAAFIATFVAGLQFRADIISKYRQEWVRELRNSIAEYQSIVGRLYLIKFSRAESETHEDVHDLIERLILSMNKIALMLDLSDTKQNSLHSLMIQVRLILENLHDEAQIDTIAALANQINDISRVIFLLEYRKATKGK